MSMLFSIFIMWVLFQNNLCSKGLALAYTIVAGVCILISSAAKTIKEHIEKENKIENDILKVMSGK